MVSVLVFSSYPLFRIGLVKALEGLPDISIVGACDPDPEDAALDFVQKNPADVLVLDMCIMKGEYFDLVRRIKEINSNIKIIMLAAQNKEPIPTRFLKAGVDAYLTYRTDVGEVSKAITEVQQGNQYIGRDCAQTHALNRVAGPLVESPVAVLSERELQVMMMIIAGQRVAAISNSLSISPKTINTYRYRLFAKLDVDSDVSLTLLAIRHGLIEA